MFVLKFNKEKTVNVKQRRKRNSFFIPIDGNN